MGDYVNSTTARFDRSYISCGIVEVHHLPQGAAKTIFSLANHFYHKANPCPGVVAIFSDVVGRDNSNGNRGEALAEALTKLQCGNVLYTPRAVNPRTGNTIQMWVFVVNHEKFCKWYQDELANRVDD